MNPSEEKAKPAEKQKALCVATRCTSVEQFVATFHRFCDESSFFVATLATRPVGLETAFSIQLEDKTPVLRGLCVVVEAWSTPANRFGRPGVRLDVRRLTNESLEVFKLLQAARKSVEGDAGKAAELASKAEIEAAEAEAAFDANAAANELSVAMASAAAKAQADVKASAAAQAKIENDAKLAAIGAEPAKPATGKIEITKFARASEPTMDPPKLPRGTRDGLPPMPPTAPPRTPPTGIPPIAVKPATQPLPRLATPTKGMPTVIEPAKLRAEGTQPVRPAVPRPGNGVTQQMPPIVDAKPAEKLDAKAEIRKKLEGLSKIPTTQIPPIKVDAPKPVINPGAPKPAAQTGEVRLPGSAYILPANPLMNLSDSSLEGFIDCALYEETGNFFRAPEYEDSLVDIGTVAPPPQFAPIQAVRSGEATDAPPSYVGPMPEAPVVSFTGPTGRTTPPPFAAQGQTAPPPFAVHLQTDPVAPLAFTARPEHRDEPMPDATPSPMLLGPSVPPDYQMPYPQQPGYAQMNAVNALNMPQPYAQERTRSTARTKAVNPRSRRGLVIGGSAAAAIVLVIAIAAAASGGDDNVNAARPVVAKTEKIELKATTPERTVEEPKVLPPTKAVETKAVETKAVETKAVTPAIATKPAPPPAETKQPPPAPVRPAVSDDPGDEGGGAQVIGSGPCQIQIATTPAGSIVRVDDRQIGPSPITIAGPCKRTKVDAKHPRYAAATKWVTPAEGTPAVVDMPMVRPTHAVTITSNPAGATVSIGGRRAGTTPTSIKLMGFTTQTLTFEKKGYSKVTQKLYSKVDNDRVTVKLTRGK